MADEKETGKLRNDVVLDAIRQEGTISPAYDGRRVVIGTR
jgi:hypothetical protein